MTVGFKQNQKSQLSYFKITKRKRGIQWDDNKREKGKN